MKLGVRTVIGRIVDVISAICLIVFPMIIER